MGELSKTGMSEQWSLTYRSYPIRCSTSRGDDGGFSPVVTVKMPRRAFASTRYLAEFQVATDVGASDTREHLIYVGSQLYRTFVDALDAGVTAAKVWIDKQVGPLTLYRDFGYEIFLESTDVYWFAKVRIYGSSAPLSIFDLRTGLISITGKYRSELSARNAATGSTQCFIDQLILEDEQHDGRALRKLFGYPENS
jgi:hypothetical protein